MRYGYARVSTAGQQRDGNSLADQEARLRESGAEKIFVEAYTGTKIDRPEFKKLLSEVREGDTVIVTKLDRLSRSAKDGLEIVDMLIERGVTLEILNMGKFDGSPIGKLMRTMLFGFAEFERDMIVQRTSEGKAIARQREGFSEGRPRKEVAFREQLVLVENGEKTVIEACKDLGISRRTWYNRMKEAI